MTIKEIKTYGMKTGDIDIPFGGSLLKIRKRPNEDVIEVAASQKVSFDRKEPFRSTLQDLKNRIACCKPLTIGHLQCDVPTVVNLVNSRYYVSLEPPEAEVNPPLIIYCRLLEIKNGDVKDISPQSANWNREIELTGSEEFEFENRDNLMVSIAFIRKLESTEEFLGEYRIRFEEKSS